MAKVYYLNGEYIAADAAALPVTDLAIVRGYGVFDFFRTYNGQPIQLERNIQRLRNSAAVIQLDVPWSNEELSAIILETIARNGFEDANVRVIVTGGDSPDFITPQANPRLIVYVEPLKPLPATWYADGAKVITVEEERYLPLSKSLNYTPAILAQKQAKAANAIEALYVDRSGNVREGTTTNYFAFYGVRVVTPNIDILPGVTRGRVIEILGELGYTLEEREISLEELLQADEVVITAANKQIVPIVQINDQPVGDGTVGEHAQTLMNAFRSYVARYAVPRATVSES